MENGFWVELETLSTMLLENLSNFQLAKTCEKFQHAQKTSVVVEAARGEKACLLELVLTGRDP